MKKVFSILLPLLLILFITACSDSGTLPAGSESSPATEAEASLPAESESEAVTEEPAVTVERPTGTKVKVVMIAGQSNAVGYAFDSSLLTTDPRYDAARVEKLRAGNEKVLIRYSNNPLESGDSGVQFGPHENETFEPVAFGQGCASPFTGYYSIGPEVGLAEALSNAYPDETFYIVKCATSGANLSNRWNSGLTLVENNLYQQMIDFTKEAMLQLEADGLAPEIVAFCWMQGESDAQEGNLFSYPIMFEDLINGFKAELARSIPDNGMAVVDAGITQFWPSYQTMNKMKQRFQSWSNKHFYFDTNDLPLNSDNAHYDGFSQFELGNRFGRGVIEAIGMMGEAEIYNH